MEKVTKGLFRITGYVADQAGCANIRVIIPFILLNQLQVKNFHFQAYFNNIFTKDLAYYKNSTVIQFQRSATRPHLEYYELVRRKLKILSRSALIYEIDDDVYNIPEWNFAKDYYKGLLPHISEMISRADGVTVSTETLKQFYSKFNSNITVIPNHLPRFTWGATEFSSNDYDRPKIVYPCSSNHFAVKKGTVGGDIGPVLMDYIRRSTDDWDWIFVGGCPHELEDLIKAKKITRYGWYSVYEYPRFLKSLKADIGIAPLEMLEFNRSKSNIKALEFTALGIPGVYTRIEPYNNMSLQAQSEEEFISHLGALRNIDTRHQIWQQDHKTLADGLFWEDNSYKNLKKYVKSYLNLIEKDVDFI